MSKEKVPMPVAGEKLKEWLKAEGRKQSWVVDQINDKIGTSYATSTFSCWIRGHRVPDDTVKRQIENITQGDVTAESWDVFQ